MQRIIDVACEACRKAENAGLLSRGRLRRAAARTVAEQSELLRRTAPWLKDAAIPGTYAGAAAYRDEASRITLDHVRKPFQAVRGVSAHGLPGAQGGEVGRATARGRGGLLPVTELFCFLK